MNIQDTLDQKSADQEILTFNFLQEVIMDHAEGEWKEVTLDQYHENEGQIKATFSMVALNFLTTEKRNGLQLQVWTAPYGYFYMWQFAVNGLRYFNETGLSVVPKYLEPLIEDMENNLDYGRFNHFGRLLAIAKFNIYSTSVQNDLNEKISDILSLDLMDEIGKQKDGKLSEGAAGENNDLSEIEVESCAMSVRVIDKFIGLRVPFARFNGSGTQNAGISAITAIQEILEFVVELKAEDWAGERTKLFADIERDLNDMIEFIQPK